MDLLITVSDARSLEATDLSRDLAEAFRRRGVKILPLVGKADISDINPPNSFNFKGQKNRNAILRLIRDTLRIDAYAAQGYRPHLQVLVAGFPNTGKSTLINLLKGRRVAAAENLPGKTKRISRFPIGDNIWVYDTPGILNPKHSKESVAKKLFLINSIPCLVKNSSEILEEAYGYLHRHYSRELSLLLGGDIPEDYSMFLEGLAGRFHFRKSEGAWDTDRAEAKFLSILWSGQIKLNWDRDV